MFWCILIGIRFYEEAYWLGNSNLYAGCYLFPSGFIIFTLEKVEVTS